MAEEKKVKQKAMSKDELKNEIELYKDKWLRTVAEYENYRKRTDKEKTEWFKMAKEKVLLDVCDVVDSFERALSEEIPTDNFVKFRKNVEKICVDLASLMETYDFHELDELRHNFNETMNYSVPIEVYEKFTKGIEMIQKQLLSLLSKHDVFKLDVLNKEFDPKYHEALSMLPAKQPKNTIIGVIQNGYMMGDRVIRYAKVAVSNGEN
jgi:molecular chaperone GrpE